MTLEGLLAPKQSPWPWWVTELDKQTRGRGMRVVFPLGAKLADGSRLSAGEVLPERWSYTEGVDINGARSCVLNCLHGMKIAVKNPPGVQRCFPSREAEAQFLQRVLLLHMRDYYERGPANNYAL